MSEEKFKACLSDQKMLDKVQAERQIAIDQFDVKSTPTFFIDGTREAGALTYEQMSKVLNEKLKGK